MKKQAIMVWLVSALLVSCLSLMGAKGVEAQASREPLWSYNTMGYVSSVAISSDGNYIVAGSGAPGGEWHKVFLFSRASSTPLWSYQTSGSVKSVAISEDGAYIAVGSYGNNVYIFSRAYSTPLWSYTTGGPVNSVAISSNGHYIVAGGRDNNVYLFSCASSTPLWDYSTGGEVYSVAISSDGNYIAASSSGITVESMKIYLFSRTSSTPLWSYSCYPARSISISSDGSYIVAGSSNEVYFFSRTSSTPLWSYETSGECSFVYSVAISEDGSYIAVGDGYGPIEDTRGRVYLFSSASSSPLWIYTTRDTVWSVAISSDGSCIAAGSYDYNVYCFSRTSSAPLWSYTSGYWFSSVAISSDGSHIAAGDWYYQVRLFSRNTPPTLNSGSVSPTSGTTDTTFTYEVTYTDADDDAPSYVRVYIDGSSHTMIKVSGTYTGGALYRYTTSSPSTSPHTYYFTASDGIDTARLPTSGSYSGPTVTEQHSTTLSMSLSSFTIPIGGSKTLTATLESVPTYIIGFSDVGATSNPEYPIANKTITWSATAGSFSSSSTTTNSSGQASVTYYAPSYATTATITASFAGNSQWEASNDTATATIQFQVTLTFTKPDGSPLVNTTIYYGTSKGQETSYLGVTDSQGKITSTNSALAGGTIYFKSPDGAYSGSTYAESSGGSSNIWLTETSGTPIAESPWAIVAVILIVGGVAGMLVLKKVFSKPKSVKHIMKVKPQKPVPIKLAKTAKRVLNVKSSKLAQTKPAGPFCLHCKLKLPADAAFCPKCGRRVKR